MTEQPSGLKLPREQKVALAREVAEYLRENLDCESGELGAELLLDFVSQLIGPYHYNLALDHARLAVSRRFDGIEEDLVALERQPNVRR
jgi:uncharacterized protein (DUF2164 family)